MLNVFYGWKLQTLIQLGGWTVSGAKKFVYDVFLFLVCFVALKVMMKGAWWVSFCDAAQS
jgi:hypothetical protein